MTVSKEKLIESAEIIIRDGGGCINVYHCEYCPLFEIRKYKKCWPTGMDTSLKLKLAKNWLKENKESNNSQTKSFDISGVKVNIEISDQIKKATRAEKITEQLKKDREMIDRAEKIALTCYYKNDEIAKYLNGEFHIYGPLCFEKMQKINDWASRLLEEV